LVLELAACVVEAKKEVSNAASQALDAVGATVTNPETRKLMPFILAAIKEPGVFFSLTRARTVSLIKTLRTLVDAATDRCLEELMDATFVNSLGATR